MVSDNLQRIGGIDLNDVEILPIAASENQFFYRNKLEYTFSNRRWFVGNEERNSQNNALGFHIPAMFDRVLDIDECLLQPEPSNKIRNFIKDYALKNELTFYDVKNHTGFLRNIIIRNNEKGEVMLIVVFREEIVEEIEKLTKIVKGNFPEITSLHYVINTKLNDTIGDLDIVCYSGKNCIIEEYCTEKHNNTFLRFKIGAKSFFQTNTRQAEKLYSIAKEFAELQGNEIVYDLYTGCGTIAQFVADKAKKVVGIEYVDTAIADAKENAELNGIVNCEFFAGDMSKVLTDDFIAKHSKPDVLITDPPRAGMNPDVVAQILKVKPQKIVYISCNSATQARDIAMLKSAYKIVKSQAVDMFPQTHHIENVVKLEIR
jgi:23S rRNA (uracil1939-C5)-methyltransferase